MVCHGKPGPRHFYASFCSSVHTPSFAFAHQLSIPAAGFHSGTWRGEGPQQGWSLLFVCRRAGQAAELHKEGEITRKAASPALCLWHCTWGGGGKSILSGEGWREARSGQICIIFYMNIISLVPLCNLQEWYFNTMKQRIVLGLNKCIVHKAIRNLLKKKKMSPDRSDVYYYMKRSP